MKVDLLCSRQDGRSSSSLCRILGRQPIEGGRTGWAWEHRLVRSCGLLLLLAVGVGGCQSSWPLDRATGSMDHAEFLNVWKSYTHCRSSSDPDDIRVDAQSLDRAAHAMESKSPSPIVLPIALQHLVSKLPSRLAVDLKAMALDCALYGGQVARGAGRTRLAAELFNEVLAKGNEQAYGYYVVEAGRGLEHLGPARQVAKETSPEAPGSFVALIKRQRQRQRHMAQIERVTQLRQPSGFYRNNSLRSERRGGAARLVQTEVVPLASLAARCPADATVRQFDISAINVEIWLHWWVSFPSPGYLYVLTENIDKVREEEARNRAARHMETHDPGAGTNEPQGRWIQPLVIRASQGDCVKVSLQNQLERGEAVGLHIDDASMVVRTTGRLATMANSEAMAAPGESIDLEWYIRPSMQEGSRQFHSYTDDGEFRGMGPFGTFMVEPKRSTSLESLGSGEQLSLIGGTSPSRNDSQDERRQ